MDNRSKRPSEQKPKRLGEFSPVFYGFDREEALIKELIKKKILTKPYHVRTDWVFRTLLDLILEVKEPAFLLPKIVRFFEKVVQEKVVENLHISHFELWLNQFSGLSSEENYRVRAKIVGKHIPRDVYQIYFPIGQNKSYFGSHFVTAHGSPDLDTTVASFWGWIDAFGARVAEALHYWNVPGGAPNYQVEFKLLFDDIFSKNLFSFCAKNRTALHVSSLELVTQKGMLKRDVDSSSLSIDLEKNQSAVVLINQEGYYQGDWRTVDVEGVRQVVMLVNQMFRHFENRFQQELIALFSKEQVHKSEMLPFIQSMLSMKLYEAEPLNELSEGQRKHVTDYLKGVLNVSKGLDAEVRDLAKALSSLKMTSFEKFVGLIQGRVIEGLFDAKGHLIASRSELFQMLDQVIHTLDEAIHAARHFVDQLKISLEIKSKVFGYKPLHVSDKADVEELRSKMGNSPYLTVTSQETRGFSPIGVIHAADLYRPTLGTVTLRDFSNREETKVPSYLEIISVIDHHKSQLSGTVPSTFYISDAQSSNVTVAQLSFEINDRYSTGGFAKESILAQMETLSKQLHSNSSRRLYRRLLMKLEALDRRGNYYIDPMREFVEYWHFLFAILDDTDLLSKVTRVDVEIVRDLLNRMKSIVTQEEVEVVHFDDISDTPEFAQVAAARLLRNADLYSITQKIYHFKEVFIDEVIEKAAKGSDAIFFADTKEQNGCVRIGQFKLYPINYPTYLKYAPDLRKVFIEESRKIYARKKEIDLFIYMISTLSGLEGLFDEKTPMRKHNDELWIYVSQDSDEGFSHLRSFFNAFGASSATKKALHSIEIRGSECEKLEEVVSSTLGVLIGCPVKVTQDPKQEGLIIVSVESGSMNSRKAMISPYLPKLVV